MKNIENSVYSYNYLNMHLESPAFKRCCFCMPLRRGLIGWGYIRLAMGILALTCFIWVLTEHPRSGHYFIMLICLCCAALWDIVFNLILIVASHKKSAKLLKVSFILGLIWFIMFLAFGFYILYGEMSDFIDYYSIYYNYYHTHKQVIDMIINSYMLYSLLATPSFTFAITFVHVYVMLMIRSETKKLRNQSGEMQFVNNAAEGEATCAYALAPTAARMTNMTQ